MKNLTLVQWDKIIISYQESRCEAKQRETHIQGSPECENHFVGFDIAWNNRSIMSQGPKMWCLFIIENTWEKTMCTNRPVIYQKMISMSPSNDPNILDTQSLWTIESAIRKNGNSTNTQNNITSMANNSASVSIFPSDGSDKWGMTSSTP